MSRKVGANGMPGWLGGCELTTSGTSGMNVPKLVIMVQLTFRIIVLRVVIALLPWYRGTEEKVVEQVPTIMRRD